MYLPLSQRLQSEQNLIFLTACVLFYCEILGEWLAVDQTTVRHKKGESNHCDLRNLKVAL